MLVNTAHHARHRPSPPLRRSRLHAAALGVCALAATAGAQPNIIARLQYEASLDGTTWHSSVSAAPGNTVQVRARVIYVGIFDPTQVGGLAQFIFQPVVSNWRGPEFTGNGPEADNVIVQTQGAVTNTIGPFGGTRSTPLGTVPDAPGVYGRLSPWGAAATSSTSFYRGFVGTGANAGLMRISQAHVTNWIGAGATSGSNTVNNVSGRGGINAGQLHESLRQPSDPPFDSRLDVVVFKFAFLLSDAGLPRVLTVTTPPEAIGRRLVGGLPAEQDVVYYGGNPAEPEPLGRGEAEVQGALITIVPAPATALIALTLAWFRKRSRTFQEPAR